MTERQIQLVKESWSHVSPISDVAGDLFYNRLFEVAPGVRSMFTGDMRQQSRKLMGMLSMIVSKLDKLETLLDEIKMLAQRHDKYGAQPAHYQVVGECLIWTLAKGLGEKWNKETEESWVAAYTILSGAMITNQGSKASAVS
jgi:hemoglobin-like flavoprotein